MPDPTPRPRRPARARVRLLLLLVPLLTAGAALFAGLTPAHPAAAAPSTAPAAPAAVTLTLYWGDGCPRCEAERKFLTDLRRQYPQLVVQQYEVWKDAANRRRFEEVARQHGVDASAVPTTIVRDRVWIGFTDPIRDDLRRTVAAALRGQPVPKGLYGRAGTGTCSSDEVCTVPQEPDVVVAVPLLGQVNVGDKPMFVSTVVIGFVDGINPCSLWVISILLTIVIRTGSRRRVLAIGSAFLLVTAGMYAIYMAGIYSALTVIGYLGLIQLVVGVVAGVFGLIAVKDYFWFKRGPSLTIPDSSKPNLYRRMREVAGSRALLPALGATTVLAVGVSLLETPCTAGFPVLWTGLLASNHVGLLGSALLFVVYMVPFLLDEMAVFAVAVLTMRATKVQEKHGRLLKLIAGTVMLALAGTVVLAPDVMEDVLGATLVFGVAGVVALVVHLAASRASARRARPDRQDALPV
ncbi:MAG TPA: hypothetical protein VMU51_33620 [Mycobacteriales bacterium]|nr:hypothetical protein [Mycobacteriales bacterium]